MKQQLLIAVTVIILALGAGCTMDQNSNNGGRVGLSIHWKHPRHPRHQEHRNHWGHQHRESRNHQGHQVRQRQDHWWERRDRELLERQGRGNNHEHQRKQ